MATQVGVGQSPTNWPAGRPQQDRVEPGQSPAQPQSVSGFRSTRCFTSGTYQFVRRVVGWLSCFSHRFQPHHQCRRMPICQSHDSHIRSHFGGTILGGWTKVVQNAMLCTGSWSIPRQQGVVILSHYFPYVAAMVMSSFLPSLPDETKIRLIRLIS
jgi:hypothetical protein